MKRMDQYCSVEFSVDSVGIPYHFKIWHADPSSNFIVVRDDSRILPHLRAGDRLKMKYYSPASVYPEDIRDTAIKDISREEQGRFNGHFLVALELV
jgi:hypothetical protein